MFQPMRSSSVRIAVPGKLLCSLLTVHCSLPTAHCPLLTAHCPLPTAHRSPLTGVYLAAPCTLQCMCDVCQYLMIVFTGHVACYICVWWLVHVLTRLYCSAVPVPSACDYCVTVTDCSARLIPFVQPVSVSLLRLFLAYPAIPDCRRQHKRHSWTILPYSSCVWFF
jgi:hypothetical protein